MAIINDPAEVRVVRGGAFDTPTYDLHSGYRVNLAPAIEYSTLGFRVVAIPEPSTIAFVGLFSGGLLFIRRIFLL